jgi:hypothetical protein
VIVAAHQPEGQTAPESDELGAAVALIGSHCLAPEQGACNGFAPGACSGDSPVTVARYREDSPGRLFIRRKESRRGKKQCEARSQRSQGCKLPHGARPKPELADVALLPSPNTVAACSKASVSFPTQQGWLIKIRVGRVRPESKSARSDLFQIFLAGLSEGRRGGAGVSATPRAYDAAKVSLAYSGKGVDVSFESAGGFRLRLHGEADD